jgi:hypothetical protein
MPAPHPCVLCVVFGPYASSSDPTCRRLVLHIVVGALCVVSPLLLTVEFEPPSLGSTRRRWVRAAIALRRAALAPARCTGLGHTHPPLTCRVGLGRIRPPSLHCVRIVVVEGVWLVRLDIRC